MPRKSATAKIIRKTAEEIPAASVADLDRLRAAMEGPIDTSDIPEGQSFRRIARDEAGRLPPRRSLIREAVARELGRRKLTRYQLWKQAHARCPTLSQPAVYEFLNGQRQIGLEYVEALIAALELEIVPTRPDAPEAAQA